ncbi:MAG TPA: quinoprotein glucose dehydrogenase, partial [Nitrososphaeraceae archaeon]
DLSEDRRSLLLKGTLADRVANNTSELNQIIFGQGFGQITDIEIGPDGYLFILSHNQNLVKIFKIIPNSST